jgi:hypothetical protein
VRNYNISQGWRGSTAQVLRGSAYDEVGLTSLMSKPSFAMLDLATTRSGSAGCCPPIALRELSVCEAAASAGNRPDDSTRIAGGEYAFRDISRHDAAGSNDGS